MTSFSHPMACADARPLVGAYLDGELSEVRSTLLRKHLLDCRDCRASAQDVKTLRRWFAAPAPDSIVPSGFSARVARRAFAGDTGERFSAGPRGPAPAGGSSDPVLEPARAGARREARILPFVLQLTALAAAVVIAFAIGIRLQSRPAGENLRAAGDPPEPTSAILDQLERLNLDPQAPAAAAEPGRRR